VGGEWSRRLSARLPELLVVAALAGAVLLVSFLPREPTTPAPARGAASEGSAGSGPIRSYSVPGPSAPDAVPGALIRPLAEPGSPAAPYVGPRLPVPFAPLPRIERLAATLPEAEAPAVTGNVTAAVANLPNRTPAAAFASSLRTLTAAQPDVVLLNEVSGRSLDAIRAAAPGYDAYRDPTPDTGPGGGQAMNNVVLWRTDRWSRVDGGRVKIVDDDRGFLHGHAFTWDRYATWALLERTDGARMSVVATHQMTNPGKFPRQHGNPPMSRVAQYARGMDVVVDLARNLSRLGPVLAGGDMNSHEGQGGWTAAARMTAAGWSYAKDRGVMYLFHPRTATRLASRQVPVASDHPALLVTLGLGGPAE